MKVASDKAGIYTAEEVWAMYKKWKPNPNGYPIIDKWNKRYAISSAEFYRLMANTIEAIVLQNHDNVTIFDRYKYDAQPWLCDVAIDQYILPPISYGAKVIPNATAVIKKPTYNNT